MSITYFNIKYVIVAILAIVTEMKMDDNSIVFQETKETTKSNVQ